MKKYKITKIGNNYLIYEKILFWWFRLVEPIMICFSEIDHDYRLFDRTINYKSIEQAEKSIEAYKKGPIKYKKTKFYPCSGGNYYSTKGRIYINNDILNDNVIYRIFGSLDDCKKTYDKLYEEIDIKVID